MNFNLPAFLPCVCGWSSIFSVSLKETLGTPRSKAKNEIGSGSDGRSRSFGNQGVGGLMTEIADQAAELLGSITDWFTLTTSPVSLWRKLFFICNSTSSPCTWHWLFNHTVFLSVLSFLDGVTVITSSYKDLTLWILEKVPCLCAWEISAWNLLYVQKIDDYRFKSMLWKRDWASVVLQFLLLHLFPQVFLMRCLPTWKTTLTYPVQEWQMRRNHNNSFCFRNLLFVNNTESIPNSPKDYSL